MDDASLWESPSIGNWLSENEADLLIVGNRTLEAIFSEEELLNEEITDKCTSDIFKECSTTDECVEMLTGSIDSKYSLTHQIFYILFAKKVSLINSPFRTNLKIESFH